jgi:hypothetical protein
MDMGWNEKSSLAISSQWGSWVDLSDGISVACQNNKTLDAPRIDSFRGWNHYLSW